MIVVTVTVKFKQLKTITNIKIDLCLRLLWKHLIPESTVDLITSEMLEIENTLLLPVQECIRHSLQSYNVASNVITACMNDVAKETNKLTDLKFLTTKYSRNNFFLDNCDVIVPEEVQLPGQNDESSFMHYIPIRQTLENLVSQPSVAKVIEENDLNKTFSGIYRDFSDGNIFKNKMKNRHPVLSIILYNDAFEIVNPLGSSKRKYKLLAVYGVLGNLPPHLRSTTDNMFLILLCKEKYVKLAGYNRVFERMVEDILEIQNNGIIINGKKYFLNVTAMTSDNLGAHGVGGFNESFSGHYFCRYCEITKAKFHAVVYRVDVARTAESYSLVVENIESVENRKDIKQGSILNNIKEFHVTSGLPPCLGHDLFEGVASFDAALVLNHLIKVEKWISYEDLNRIISTFKYDAKDLKNKPSAIPTHGTHLGGHAIPNATFIKLVPMFFYEIMQDGNNKYWLLLLQLREIIELVCFNEISFEQTLYLDEIVQYYLEERKTLFPTVSLKPKHHYLRHYPDLIRQYGPLIHVWTMRFESQHQYFKHCIRMSKIFKNVIKTLSEKYQLLKAYQNRGFKLTEKAETTSDHIGDPILFKDFFEHNDFNICDVQLIKSFKKNGYIYSSKYFVITEKAFDDITFSKIVNIFSASQGSIYFTLQLYKTSFLPSYGMYEVSLTGIVNLVCISYNQLFNKFPFVAYKIKNKTFIAVRCANGL